MKKKLFQCYINPEHDKELKKMAEKEDTSKAHLVRKAIAEFLHVRLKMDVE